MGRKIPGKKHHGVKDPEKQREARDQKVKTKVNAVPKNADEQEVPKKLQRMLRLKEDVDRLRAEKRGRRANMTQEDKDREREEKRESRGLLDSTRHQGVETRLPGMKRPLRPTPVFRQKPGESERSFLNRVEVTCKAVLSRRAYEDRYGVELVDDPASGGTSVREREKDEVEEELDRRKRERAAAKTGVARRTKEEKRAQRRLREKEKRLKRKRRAGKAFREESAREGNDEAEDRDFGGSEDIAFHDVAVAPPALRQKPRGAERQRGKVSGLLLAKKMRQDVSLAKKVQMMEERKRVVEAYRSLKKGGAKMNKVSI